MAHFAEIDNNGKVLRVVVACNKDIADNGGEQSEEASKYFENICPFSGQGIKWVQTSYNNNFRKQYAGINFIYNSEKNIFIKAKPYLSWSLDSNNDWQAPVSYPTTSGPEFYEWDEDDQTWLLIG